VHIVRSGEEDVETAMVVKLLSVVFASFAPNLVRKNHASIENAIIWHNCIHSLITFDD